MGLNMGEESITILRQGGTRAIGKMGSKMVTVCYLIMMRSFTKENSVMDPQ